MAFINEAIPEVDKARIDWSKFKALPIGKNYEPSWWTIDRDKNIFLVRFIGKGPAGTWPEMFVLSWMGTLIVYEVESTSKGDLTNGIDMFWKVLRFDIPDQLQDEREKIIQTFKEAIKQFGWNYNCNQVRSVHIEFV